MMDTIYFYHEYESHGYLSNWFMSPFTYAGKTYLCTEQYMMYQKAAMFRAYENCDKIMASDDPHEIKHLGAHFPKGCVFDGTVWDRVKYPIMLRGIRAKFMQSPELLAQLLSTGDALLVECSVTDMIWSCGLGIDDPDHANPALWKGKNLLGLLLMQARSDLRSWIKCHNDQPLVYVDTRDLPTNKWWRLPISEAIKNPAVQQAIRTYEDSIVDQYTRKAFTEMTNSSLADIETSMRINIGGGLPWAGFYEMKQEIYEINKYLATNFFAE